MKICMSWLLLPALFCVVTLTVLGISVSASSSQEGAAAGDDKVKALEKQLAEAIKQIKTLGDDKKKLTDSLAKESDRSRSLEKQLADAAKQITSLTGELKKLTDAASKQADAVKALQKQNTVLSDKLASAGKADADKIKALEKELADASKKNKSLADEKAKALDLAAARAKDLETKDKLLVEAQKQNTAIAEDKAKLEKGKLADAVQLKKLGGEKKVLEAALGAATGTLAQTAKLLASEKKTTAKLTAANKKLQQVLNQTDKKLQETNERLDVTNTILAVEKANVARLDKSLAAEKRRAEEAEDMVALLQCELASRCRIMNLLRSGSPSRATLVPLCPN
jgi:chromosome segregation ATPase